MSCMSDIAKRYLALTFLITWSCWGLRAMLCVAGVVDAGAPAVMPLFVLGGFGPTIAAFVVRPDARTRNGCAHFLLAGSRGSLGWLALLASLVLAAVTLGSDGLNPQIPLFVLPTLFVITTVAGGGNEELGWRGVLQPELETRLPYPVATLAVGVIWAAWHLPLWFTPQDPHLAMPYGTFALQAVLLSFWLAGLRRRGASLLWCAVLHGFLNTLLSAFLLRLGPDLAVGFLVVTAVSLWMGMSRAPAGADDEQGRPRPTA
ncbi:hypothetical protein HMPREF2826_02045 [Olsenella sp. HMSC062G07]|nr:hypothetical protein HMPREF2826_02045 [Olsenella sp. HMSC062G07]